MGMLEQKTMRDALIEKIYKRMREDKKIFLLSADFGAPLLDKIRASFKDRFINVGIAEQNLINVSTGLALEGFTVFAYAISTFLTMRAYEQIRVNLALSSQQKTINVNLIGVGAGVSYDISGPTHHCLEDIIIMRTLPNIVVVSASDWVIAESFVDFAMKKKCPKYIRLDSKLLPRIYGRGAFNFKWEDGFSQLAKGKKVCLIATGYMTHRALKIAKDLQKKNENIGVVDVFLLRPINEDKLARVLQKYRTVITLEEGFVDKGGLDALISTVLRRKNLDVKLKNLGFGDSYIFSSGKRDFLHSLSGLSQEEILRQIYA